MVFNLSLVLQDLSAQKIPPHRLCTKVDELSSAEGDRHGAELGQMWNNCPSSRVCMLHDLPGAISKALASLTERVDQIEGKGTLEARKFS